MRKELTAVYVRNKKPEKERVEITDALGPWLRLRIQPHRENTKTAAKSWVMRFRRPDGRAGILVLGKADISGREAADEPVVGGVLTLGQARQLAAQINRERARGIDVVAKYAASKARQRAEHLDRVANTFEAAVSEFFRDHKTRWGHRPRRWIGDARLLGLIWPRDADPAKVTPEISRGSLVDSWGQRPLADIDSHDCFTAIDQARKHGIPGLQRKNGGVSEARGRKMHAALSQFFRWAVQRRKVASSPTVGVWHPGAPPSRDRVLSDAEIKQFWRATDEVGEPFRAALRLLLLTGARVSEITGMHRTELDDDGTWTIPAVRTKNHRPHAIPLPPLALEILAAVPRIECDLVFTTTGTSPISGWSKIKRALDAVMGPKVSPWRLHDLRRTAASGMSRLGVRSEVVERALNHISGSFRGVAGTYQRDPLSEEVRVAMLRWSQHVSGLATPKPAKVATLQKTL